MLVFDGYVMSKGEGLESIICKAAELEKNYDWLGAVEYCRKALGLEGNTDFLKAGRIQERIGYDSYRAAMQAEDIGQFRGRILDAVAHYEKAKELYGELNKRGESSRMLRCSAMLAYLGYWLAPSLTEKKRLIEESWKLAEMSLSNHEQAEDALEYKKAFDQFSSSTDLMFAVEWDCKTREKMLREAVELGERAITFFSSFIYSEGLATAYVKTANYLQLFAFYFLDLNKKDEYVQKARGYWQKAGELSKETAALGLLSVLLGTGPSGYWGEGTDDALNNFEKALEYARKTKDRLVIGCALDLLAYHVYWKVLITDDSDEKAKFRKKILQYAEDAKRQYSAISFTSPRGGVNWVEAPYAEYHWLLANSETDLGERLAQLKRALDAAPDALKRAEDSGYPASISSAHHVFSRILASMAALETDSEKKRVHLEKALIHGTESISIIEQLQPYGYWNLGVRRWGIAIIKSELADLTRDPEGARKTLHEAILDIEASLGLCIKDAEFYEREGSLTMFPAVGRGQYQYGDFLDRLYRLTSNTDYLRKAVGTFEDAAESFQKLNQASRMAECYWKVAQIYHTLEEHLKAAENFKMASGNYGDAAKNLPQLRSFYEEHSLYMHAWDEIEKAVYHHERREYNLAKEHFEQAASIHICSRKWGYMASNYSAWAQVEAAEELSTTEQSEAAIQAFEQAAKLFNRTRNLLQTHLNRVEIPDERQMAIEMIAASNQRREYCRGRIYLEEARILDKRGDHHSSSEKYGSAVEAFEKIAPKLESELDRREFKFIICISRAWQKMTQAEAEASPRLYVEASELFEEAKEHTPNEQVKNLTLGHSRFCRALEAGTKFADTRDIAMHDVATQLLDRAAGYYLKAGFQKASEFAEATGLLLDAYMHMDNAKRENDPEKKAKLYMVTERVLQTSAGSFMKAEHPEKREQVLRLLKKVKREREIAVSVIGLLHAPTIPSATSSLTMPAPTHEEPVGLKKFEHADIQANVIARQRELKVGDTLDLEMELVNVGRGSALLIKVTELIPQGFELAEKPGIYRVEDSCLNMKGKRLDPLKTEEVRLVLKPKVQGTFPLRPRIHYLDENGKYKAHEPEPIDITVKELGIKGWLKGR